MKCMLIILMHTYFLHVMITYRLQAWPNPAGPSCIVSQGNRRRWTTRFSTHPTPSFSLKQRTGSGRSWWVKDQKSHKMSCFYWVWGSSDLRFCLVFEGLDGFPPDRLHTTDSHAQVLMINFKCNIFTVCGSLNFVYIYFFNPYRHHKPKISF